MVDARGSANGAPATLAELSLPPMFVADHCLRTFFYQGAQSAAELARRWLVPPEIGFQIVDQLKAEGLLQADASQTTFDRHGRIDLTPLGRERAAQARERTWYSGPLPVSLAELNRRADAGGVAPVSGPAMREALAVHHVEGAIADEIGAAMSGAETVVVAGLTSEEQPRVAQAIGGALAGETLLPHALYAAGAVVRLFDARYHRRPAAARDVDDEMNILRSGTDSGDGQWARIARPIVTLKGGIAASEVLPSYDAEARFYIAPAPFAAAGGMLAITHADLITPQALAELSRLWLVPGQSGSAILVLRTGERIELPWRAAVLFFAAAPALELSGIATRIVDASLLQPAALRTFLQNELRGAVSDHLIDVAAARLDDTGDGARAVAASVARRLRSRAAYEGDEFRPTEALVTDAIDQVCGAGGGAEKLRLVS